MKRLLRKYSFPGLKKWFFFVVLALFAITFGVALILKAHPVTMIAQGTWNVLSFIADRVPPTISGIVAIILGTGLLFFGFYKSNKQVLNIVAPDNQSLFETLDRAHMANKGFKIACIGGGTGLSNMLKGLKNYSSNITAIVTVADDGGSSGRLRESMDIVPPGDIRNCIAALSHDDEVITQLFQYRFDDDAPQDLKNHSFGNLFLTALVELGGSKNMADAVAQACRILKARGTVLPVSNEPMHLIAEMEDGTRIEGESKIPIAKSKVVQLSCKEPRPEILPGVVEAINEAEIIIIGPGSLYTSILPNLLMPDLVRAIAKSTAPKIYVCNVMTQPGETSDYSCADHIRSLLKHTKKYLKTGQRLIDFVLVNDAMPHKKQLVQYRADNQYPVELDIAEIKELDVEIRPANLLQNGNFVRHNPYKLAKAIIQIYQAELKQRYRDSKKLIEGKFYR